MNVRPAEEKDIEPCLELGRQFWDESHYGRFTFNNDKAVSFGKTIIGSPWSFFWVAEDEGKTVGFNIAHLENPAFSYDLMAIHDLLFVNKNDRGHMAGLKLMRVYDHWAKENGAVYATFIPSGMGLDERWDSFSSHLGYEKMGSYFRKEL